ncbi:hypothetical protein AB0L25_33345 [Spirillospora sp. NPDC052242]
MNSTSENAIRHLTALADRLAGHSALHIDRAFVQSPPQLTVKNVDARDGRKWELVSGSIRILMNRGTSWFTWDDGDRLGPVDALEAVAQRIIQALTVGDAGSEPESARSGIPASVAHPGSCISLQPTRLQPLCGPFPSRRGPHSLTPQRQMEA